MVVQRDTDYGVYEDAELGIVRYKFRERWIEGVNAFYQQNGAGFELKCRLRWIRDFLRSASGQW